MLTPEEQTLYDGALNIGVQLRAAKNEQHRGLGQIILGVCAILAKREPELLVPRAAGDSSNVDSKKD